MELLCTLYPVDDLDAAAAVYQAIGFRDVARPDQDTVLLAGPDSPYVDVMLERHPVESQAGAGPVFRIADVAGFIAAHSDLDWVFGPFRLPTGDYALFKDPSSNPVRLVDFSAESRYASLFRPSA